MKYKFALAAAAMLLSTGAQAQFENSVYIPPYNPGLQLLNDSIRGDIEDDSDESPNVRSSASSTSVNFRYIPSNARTKQNVANFIAKARKVDPVGADGMQQIFANTDVIGEIDKAMGSMGLRADNVADAYAFWWLVAWHAANNESELPSRATVLAVKQQAANALSTTPQFSSASDTLKQELAESMLIQAAMIDAHIDAAAGNPAQQAALAKAVNQGAKQMELDLTTMDLTEQGFVPRSGGRSDAGDVNVPGEERNALAANDNAAGESDTGKLALYGVGGAALLAGMFALGKSFGGKG